MKRTFGLGPSGTVMGEGRPKICVPIVAETKETIREKAEEISNLPVEVVEWRADFYEEIFTEGKLEEILAMLRQILKSQAILYTFRSAGEGGQRTIDKETYYQLNERAAACGLADLIDVEAFMDETRTETIFENCKNWEYIRSHPIMTLRQPRHRRKCCAV